MEINKKNVLVNVSSLSALIIFVYVAFAVANGYTSDIDYSISENITELHFPTLVFIVKIFTYIFSPITLAMVTLLLSIVYLVRKKYVKFVLLQLAVVNGAGITILLKHIFERQRPVNGVIFESGYSFPSAHASLSMIFFGLVIYLYWRRITNKWLRYIFTKLNLLLVLIIGLSRVYLNVHWFSDVIGGFFLGYFWITFLILIFNKYSRIKHEDRV